MRGEHMGKGVKEFFGQGSSPHARGAHRDARALVADGGIIPACAGSTRSCAAASSTWRDHPRMRGEHAIQATGAELGEGSSPHARGARGRRAKRQAQAGIIPACAGSTLGAPSTSRGTRDHPRMRGEHGPVRRYSLDMAGSSPHARGARAPAPLLGNRVGIIPACAGSTKGYDFSILPQEDHPRMRGEHVASTPYLALSVGSSPHARGAPDRQHHGA